MKATPVALVLAVSAIAGAGGAHPEWGPYPPVAPFTRASLPGRHSVVHFIFPIVGTVRYGNDYNVNRGRYRHTGIDIKAAKMTPIVAPFAGTLGMKRNTFWIYGDNGWAVLGTHLNDDNVGRHDHRGGMDNMFAPNLRPGMHVSAGQFIGYVGESGDATGTHLHFELYAPGAGSIGKRIRNPFYSLKAAQVLHKPRVAIERAEDRPADGRVRLEACIRKVDTLRRIVTLLVFARQASDGHLAAVSYPEYVKVLIDGALLEQCGGWEALAELDESQAVSAYVSGSGGVLKAHRLVVPFGHNGS